MVKRIILLSGQIASGKTTLGSKLADSFGIKSAENQGLVGIRS